MPVVKERVARRVPIGPIRLEHLDYTVHKLYVDQYSFVSATVCRYGKHDQPAMIAVTVYTHSSHR